MAMVGDTAPDTRPLRRGLGRCGPAGAARAAPARADLSVSRVAGVVPRAARIPARGADRPSTAALRAAAALPGVDNG